MIVIIMKLGRLGFVLFIALVSLCIKIGAANVIIVADELVNNDHEQSEDVQTTTKVGETDDNVIVRIEKLGRDRPASDDTIEEKISDQNTTLPSLVCWELTCPNCTKQESPFRCFARGFLEVAVRTGYILFFVLLLALCFASRASLAKILFKSPKFVKIDRNADQEKFVKHPDDIV